MVDSGQETSHEHSEFRGCYHSTTAHTILMTLQDPTASSRYSLPSIVLLVSPSLFSVYDEAFQLKKKKPTHTPLNFFLYLPLTDNLSPAVSATMKNMLTFPRRALLWHKVMDLRPSCFSDDGSSSSQRGAKLTVYLRLTLRASSHLFFFCLFSSPFLATFTGFTLEPAYETRLFFRHCLIITTSHFPLLFPACFLFIISFFAEMFHIWSHDDIDKQIAPILKCFHHVWAFYWHQSTKFIVSEYHLNLSCFSTFTGWF